MESVVNLGTCFEILLTENLVYRIKAIKVRIHCEYFEVIH